MIDFEKVTGRIKHIRALSKDVQVAELFGLSPQDFNRRKKRGTLLSLIVDWAINEKINTDWLLTGRGDPYIKDRGESVDQVVDEDPEVAELLGMTREILKSDSDYALSLSANIRSFHRAVKMERDLEQRVARIEQDRARTEEKIRREDPPEEKEELIKRRGM